MMWRVTNVQIRNARQVAPPISSSTTTEAERGAWLGRVEALVGSSHLDPSHPLAILLGRRHWFDMLELHTLGACMARLAERQPRELDAIARKVLDRDENNARGAAFEILAAGLFHHDTYNPVDLPSDPHQPGFDFSVRLPRGTLRISCKARVKSERERRFLAMSETFFRRAADGLHPRSHSIAGLFWKQLPAHDRLLDEELAVFRQALGDRERGGIGQRRTPNGLVLVKPWPKFENLSFWKKLASFSLTTAMEHHRNEQVRVRDPVADAIAKFRKHNVPLGPTDLWAIAIKLPGAIRWVKAREILLQELQTAPEVSAIWAVRPRVVSTNAQATAFNYYVEFLDLENPYARYPVRDIMRDDAPFVVSSPTSRIERAEFTLVLDGGIEPPMPITESYAWEQSRRFFYVGNPGTASYSAAPNSTTYFVDARDDGVILHGPPSEPCLV